MTESGRVSADRLDQIDGDVDRLVDGAVAEAKASPEPGPEDLLTNVYVKY